MKHKLEWPENLRDVMVTYEKVYRRGPYGDRKEKVVVTKRGFYIKIFDHLSVPPDWRKFNGVLLPHGWGGDSLKLEDIIKWEYCDDEE